MIPQLNARNSGAELIADFAAWPGAERMAA